MSGQPTHGSPARHTNAAQVLAGGGDMGALARSLDWSRTPVGPVETWPQSLRTALSILFESKFPMLLCWGPQFIQFYNDPFRPILGATKHPALGKSTRETFAEAWHIIGPLFDQVMGGQAVGFEDMLVPLDRYGFLEECYFHYSYSPIRDESGQVAGVLVTCTETTARVLAERRLGTLRELASQAAEAQEEHAAWRRSAASLASNAADLPLALVYTLEPDGRTATQAGDAPASMGPKAILLDDETATWPLARAIHAGDPQLVLDVRSRIGDQPSGPWPEFVESALVLPITRPGLTRPYGFLVAGISPRLALNDKYRDFLTLVADQIATAVANARAHDEEKHRSEALLELDRQKTAFFSNVSHEFRTPLTLMLGPLEKAIDRTAGGLDRAEAELVYRNATRLLRLVNNLLDFSRIEAGRAQASFEATDLAVLTRDLASTFESLMEQAGLAFEIDCAPLSAAVHVDRGMWEKILLNLLSNAFKFTLSGRVRVQLREVARGVELRVQDTGTGIRPADLPRIFDRFHRVEGAPSRTFEGSGIGLALVRELVRMHGGDVTVESVEGQGSTFIVTLPRRPAPEAAPTARDVRAAAAASQPYLEEATRWRVDRAADAGPQTSIDRLDAHPADDDIRILVVDDNADMREYLRRLLGGRWTVEVAGDGRDALRQMARRPPDLVLADVMMPELDGLELVRRIRGNAATRTIPVILLSARAGEEARIDGLSVGADDYMVKPFSSRELVARIATHLEVSRLRRETSAQNERLLTLIRMAPAAIALVRGPDHVYEIANDLYYRLVGRRDLVGKPGRTALPELATQGVWDLFDRVYASGEPHVAHEFRAELDRRGNGELEVGFFDFVLQPLNDARGQIEGILIHAIDVTEQVVTRRSLDDARKAAESANRAKDEFMAMLGHELRNPLAPILTALQLMTLRGETGAQKEREVIDRQVRHVVRLVDDLLDVSRIARGRIELKRERIEIAAVVAKAIEVAGPLMEQKEQVLQLDVAPSGLAVDGDPTRLQQIVLNLLNNAAKYTGTRGRISVSAALVGESIELSVRDSGIGIDPAVLPTIFDLFVQERQALDRSEGGLGLGLAIVRNLAELHGGSVQAFSAGRGHGSEFILRLPVSHEPAGTLPTLRTPAAPATENAGLRVLIVDDNEDAVALLADVLTFAGFAVETALDGPTAVVVAEMFAPHVAILDIGLPVMDGYELAARLRSGVSAPKLIAVTGYGSETDRRRSAAAGFDAHLVKPVDVPALTRQVRDLARQAQEERSAQQLDG